MNNLSLIEHTKNKYELIAKIVISTIAILAVAPFIFFLIKGIIGVAAAIATASIIIALTPAISLAIANLGVAALKLEASRNPVETLQNEYRERAEQLEHRKLAIEECTVRLKTFESKVLSLKSKYPAEAAQFDEQLHSMHQLVDLRKEKYQEAVANLKQFHDIVEKAAALWDVTQSLSDTSTRLNVTEEFYSELRTNTALDSVQLSLNRSFAALDTSLLEAATEKKLLENK
jgi:hypothetical protein